MVLAVVQYVLQAATECLGCCKLTVCFPDAVDECLTDNGGCSDQCATSPDDGSAVCVCTLPQLSDGCRKSTSDIHPLHSLIVTMHAIT